VIRISAREVIMVGSFRLSFQEYAHSLAPTTCEILAMGHSGMTAPASDGPHGIVDRSEAGPGHAAALSAATATAMNAAAAATARGVATEERD
jgi:hypothetical protein